MTEMGMRPRISSMALATVLIHLIDDFPLWKYLDDDDDGDLNGEGDYGEMMSMATGCTARAGR
jgi:hypothetical protein